MAGVVKVVRAANKGARKLPKSLIDVTPAAAQRLSSLVKQQGNDIAGIRLTLKEKGCSGKSYDLEIVKEPPKFDEVVQVSEGNPTEGIKLYIDSKAILSVIGTQLDFVEDKLKKEFIFVNPNIKGVCGCGESFAT
eukprot:TRINITY_DN842_c0_g1_i2.p1 TRINITY_DN842_c0_g1~~TRINITY_DN842_c0_g1_i2.p1  ORF type:complete len:135 (+),score=26.93 TRINITY_DN842_c0_g1_i2:93-497(+)